MSRKAAQNGPKDLRDELNSALQGEFLFDGSFYCAEKLSLVPNPCLNIEGAGPVGLPLSERDAKAIIQVATQAPFGHGTETVVDTNVRNTWEVDPRNLKFDNPEWSKFVETTIVKTVWAGLGVAKPTSKPKCELYKLLLYETGSHFLPHQDTEKSPGMFATVVVVLPSPYQGGQVHVTHNSKTEVIDLSANSHLTTSILAWYTDVTHEVKPITSGYRLALSYNLIHTSDPNAVPCLPKMDDAVVRVQQVLEKWRLPPFKDEPREKNLLAYLLKHQYNNNNLSKGAKCLKGQDAHLVAHVRAAAEEAGYLVLLGALEYHMNGYGDDDGPGKHEEWGTHDSSNVGFMEVEETELKVEHIVDLDGTEYIGKVALELEDTNLVPKDPFDSAKPDKREYEGYMGNGAGSLDEWYRRTVLILVHKDDADPIFLEEGGIFYALAKLQSLSPEGSNEEGKKLLAFLLENVTAQHAKIARQVAGFAIQQGSLESWKTMVEKPGNTIATFGAEGLASALKAFTFDEVRPSCEVLLQQEQSLKDRINLLETLQSYIKEEDQSIVTPWCDTWTTQALKSLGCISNGDIPALLDAAKKRGTPFLAKEILPQFVEFPESFDTIASFAGSAYQDRDSIPTSVGEDIETVEWDALMTQWLDILTDLCDVIQVQPAQNYSYRKPDSVIGGHIARYLRVVHLCVATEILEPCEDLCQRLLLVSGNVSDKFITVYQPFITQFVSLCKQIKFDPLTPPFDDLLRKLVASYLHSILGSSSAKHLAKVRKLGCGCYDCNELDQFISNPSRTQHSFTLYSQRGHVSDHLETRISKANDLVSFQNLRGYRSHTLQVTKQPPVVKAQQWPTRLANAKAFLASIGDDTTIARLMGERYPEVELALQGTQRFSEKPIPANSAEAASSTSAVSEVVDVDSAAAEQPQTTGQKRKRSDTVNVVDHGVIDLT